MADTARPVEVVPGWPAPPDDSVVGTPGRRPASVRRTAHINMVWPGGFGTPLQLRGRARDLLTPASGDPEVLGEAGMTTSVGDGRTVVDVEAWPARPTIRELIGAKGGTNFRSAIDDALPGERESATPLYFLLDDIAGTSLISGFAWHWKMADEWAERPPQRAPAGGPAPEPLGMRKGRVICSGLRPGGYAQQEREGGRMGAHFLRHAGDLSSPDPWAWHEIEPPADVCMRRRRRVDVWLDGDRIGVDAHFRDSAWDDGGTEMALHEYTLQATVDRATREVIEVAAQPRVLPFPECPGAAPHVTQLLGLPVGGFRTSVQDTLKELECCTHLNDMLRCLAEVHALAGHLEEAHAAG